MLKPTFDESELQALLTQLLPSWDGRPTPLPGGTSSQAYMVDHDGRPLVLRLNTRGEGFAKDAIAARLASPELPIPAVLAVGQAAGGLHYALSERALGAPLNTLSADRELALAPSLLDALVRIHGASLDGADGYGYWDAEGRGRWRSWGAFLRSVRDDGDGIFPAWASMFADGRLDQAAWEPIFATLAELSKSEPPTRTLVHGDIGFDNVIVEGQQITGIIDWASAMYGDPLYDLAWLSFWSTSTDWIALWRARPELSWGADAPRRLSAAWCFVALTAARFFAFSEQPASVEWTLQRLRERLAD
jgi:hygromycin-B 4-O-kinase